MPLTGHLQATSPPTTDPCLSLKKKTRKRKKYVHSSPFSSQICTAEVEIVTPHPKYFSFGEEQVTKDMKYTHIQSL